MCIVYLDELVETKLADCFLYDLMISFPGIYQVITDIIIVPYMTEKKIKDLSSMINILVSNCDPSLMVSDNLHN